MSPSETEVDEIIIGCLSRLRSDLGLPAIEDASPRTAILGGDSDLDSMAVVHLIVDLESSLEAKYGRNWILADERALSRHRSPFRSVEDLRQFIIETTPDS